MPNEFHDRLAFLCERWPQAEIARKTGTQRNNVSRYMRGGKMPMDFGAELVRKLGVNPAWLLVGEGTAFLSDVNSGTERMAGDLLELVAAMNSVASMQLGSLTGKHHLKVLRELNDALTRYQDLRARINERTAPIFDKLLTDYWAALDAWQLDKADDLKRAAEQVARLCDDEALQARFDRTLSYHAFLRRDGDAAIRAQSKLFRRALARDALIDPSGLNEAFNLANALQSVGRLRESQALCEGVRAMSGETLQRSNVGKFLLAMSGYALMEQGNLHEALRRIVEAEPQPEARMADAQRSMLIMCLMYTGRLTFQQALDMGECGQAHRQGMVAQSLWRDDTSALAQALKRWDNGDGRDWFWVLVRHAAECDGGEMRKAAEFVKEGPPTTRAAENEHFDRFVYITLLARKCKDRSARKWLAKADEQLQTAPANLCMSMLARTMHFRNAQLLKVGGEVQERANEFFREHYEKGFGAFAGWVA